MTRPGPRRSSLLARTYDPAIEPVERLGLGGLWRETLRRLSGGALELGVGAGRSLAAYPGTVSSITGIDPDESMLSGAADRAQGSRVPVRLLSASAEELPFPDEGFDAVTASLTLCAVCDQRAALREAWRVLAGGCHLDRRILDGVRGAGFAVERVERYLGGLVLRIHARRDS